MQIPQNVIGRSSVSIYKKMALGILFLGLLIFLIIESSNKGDFHIFLEASKSLINGDNIYERTYFDGYHYFYSILFAILIYPFTFLPVQLAVFLWLGLNVFFLYRLYIVINKLLPLYLLSENSKKWFWIIAVIFSMRLILENLHVAQITIFLLYLCLEGIFLINTKKNYKGALLIALGINIKLLPVVLLPYLLYRKKYKASGLVVLFTTIFLFIPIVIIGPTEFNKLMTTWLSLINPVNSQHILDVEERSFHSLTTLLSTLLVENVPDMYALKIRRNVADISLENLKIAITCVRLIFIAYTLYFLRTMPFKKAKDRLHNFWEVSYILCLIPLIFPHQQHYAFLLIAPAFSYCVYYVLQFQNDLSDLKKHFIITSLAIIYLLANLKLIFGNYNEYYEHFKILTYGAIFLVIILSILPPPKPLKNS
ncbi:MAG: glycosyltransferase family 87 protein [Bacteroidota bacterium]